MFSSFMINTWIVSTIVAAVAGVVGFFVVVRGSAFAAHTLPLGAFPGAAAANLLGVSQFLGLAVFSGLGVVGIYLLGRRGRHDVATGLCLTMLLGFGALFLSLTREYSQEVYGLLFGEPLGVSSAEVTPITIASIFSIGVMIVWFRPLLLNSVSSELGEANGISTSRVEIGFLSILALATTMAVPVVGALLVFSLLVGPASAARSLVDRPFVAMALSVGISLVSVWASIALSYLTNWPIGFFVGGSAALAFTLGRASFWGRAALAKSIVER